MRIFSHDKKKNASTSFHNVGRFLGVSFLTTALITTSAFSSPIYAAPSSTDIKKKTGDLQNEIQDLQGQLHSLTSEVQSICSETETLIADMEKTKIEMAEAQEKGAKQYEAMKLRIKYIYESGGVNAIELLCSSRSMAEFLNMSEFVQSINEYDRKKLQELIDTQNEIEKKGHTLEKQQAALDTMREQLEKKKTDLEARLSNASTDLSYYEDLLKEVKKAESLVKPPANSPSVQPVTPDKEKPQNTPNKEPEQVPDKEPPKEPPKEPVQPEIPVEPSDKQKLGSFKITHYCPCFFCCGAWGSSTATGTIPTPGRTIAVDPSVIPLGSKVEINGHVYIAEDTGGAIRGNKIDIFVADHNTALSSGVYYADVYLLH